MTVYLEQHPPARRQFRSGRRSVVTGAIVVHTAENSPDLVLPDGGAEAVARFISRRTDAAGSYHSIVDSDSVVQLGRYNWEMFGEATGGNRWALHLSFACRADQWDTLPDAWVAGAIAQARAEIKRMAAWLDTQGVSFRWRKITAVQYHEGESGLIGHADLDPERRSDPGTGFPWLQLLGLWPSDRPLANPVEALQLALVDAGFDLGEWGPVGDGVDGQWGADSTAGLAAFLDQVADGDVTFADVESVAEALAEAIRHPSGVELRSGAT